MAVHASNLWMSDNYFTNSKQPINYISTMSSVLADFTAQLITETPTAPEPTTARIILGSEQLVLAVSENEKEVVPLSDIMDINPGSVPQIFESPSGKPVTTAYTHEHNRR